MPRFLILLLYNLAYLPALLFMAPSAARKMRARGGQWSDFWQRLGFFDAVAKNQLAELQARGRVWWVHAVSVGEIGIAAKLIREIRPCAGGPGIVLSTTTPTGHAEARKIAVENPGAVVVIYNPLDFWFTVRRCLRLIKPERLVLVEAEVWPNLVHAARQRGMPVSLVNARLSPKSARRYGYVLPLVRPVFGMLSQCFVQEPEDMARWETLGVSRARIACTGSIKFDSAGQSEPPEEVARLGKLLEATGWRRDDKILMGASTHTGEELEIAKVYGQLRGRIPGLHLILVPRHVERATSIEKQLRDTGLTVARRTTLEASRLIHEREPDVLLVDTTGEQRAWQHHATAVVVGKSFRGIGGQNPAEAVAAGRPVFFGPHMENFTALVRQLLAVNGAVQVADFAELEARLAEFMQDPAASARLAEAGAEVLRTHEGAAARTAQMLAGVGDAR